MKTIFGTPFPIPSTVLGITNYVLKANPEELSKIAAALKTHYPNAFESFTIDRAGRVLETQAQESEKWIQEVLEMNPESIESYHLLSKLKLAENDFNAADLLIKKALNLAANQRVRQWRINELIETQSKIKALK